MNLELAGKVALVTGSSRGIGLAIAQRLHSEGCKLVLNSRNRRDIEILCQTMTGSIAIAADVTVPREANRLVNETLEQLGKLDMLICNVGSGSSVPAGQETLEEWQRVFALNLWSTTNMVEAAYPALVASTGSIVCVSSICGVDSVPGAPVTYSTAKAALNAYVRGISRHLGKSGVRINAIAPGNINFDGSVWSRKIRENAESVATMLRNEVALSRLGTPQDVAALVAFVCSPVSNYATGSVWPLDGGQVR